MGGYNIQWDLVVIFVIFMSILLIFEEKKKPAEDKAKGSAKTKSRRRSKRSGFRRMRSPAARAYARARNRELAQN